jgi:hypothetical protein
MPSKITNSNTAFEKTLNGILAGIQANLQGTTEVALRGQNVQMASLVSELQAYLDKCAQADQAKQGAQDLIRQRRELQVTTQKDVAAFAKWVVVHLGEAALPLFGLPLPKPRVITPAKQAIGTAKRLAKLSAKAKAKAALAPREDYLVVLDANGHPIGK